MAVISITYREGNKKNLGYVSVELNAFSKNNINRKSFNSGDFVKDWYDLIKHIIQSDINKEEHIVYSSSVDHFIMDGAPFRSAYLKFKNDKPYLSYEYTFKDEGIELFVKKETNPTWEELKKICEDVKV